MHAFPIPVVALGPGSQQEDETLDYLPMPHDMRTFRTCTASSTTVRCTWPTRGW